MIKVFQMACAAAIAFALAEGSRAAEEAKLKAGDPAPPLYLTKFVKGEPVTELQKGKIYIIECWATWCGPCVAAMPHVTEVQQKYADKGVIVIGVNVLENDVSRVEPFVKKQGERMGYRVALEQREGEGNPRGKMASEWLSAAGQGGIPCSFLIDRQGKIAWIGHPVLLDRPLSKVVEGTFDAAEQTKFDKSLEELETKLGEAEQAKDYDKAIAVTDQILADAPGMGIYLRPVKLRFYYMKGDYTGGNKLAGEMAADEVAKDPSRATTLAFSMLSAPDPSKVDADLALRLTRQAAAKLNEDPNGARTADMLLAKAYAAKGDYAKAIEHQEKVVGASASSPRAKQAAEKELEEYKQKAAAATAGKQ
jgi:thiol-disulfide isomerase/thioredoxin